MLAWACCAGDATYSLETLGTLRYNTSTERKDWGAGADLGLRLNRYVLGHVRAIAYSTDSWRGGAIDEGSLLIEGELLRSSNRKMVLSVIGGADRQFTDDVWGLSAGPRLRVFFSSRFSVLGELRARIFERSDLELVPTLGLSWAF